MKRLSTWRNELHGSVALKSDSNEWFWRDNNSVNLGNEYLNHIVRWLKNDSESDFKIDSKIDSENDSEANIML